MGKKNKQRLADYINNLDADSMTGNWKPGGRWHDVHGDCKSSTQGKWTMQTMTTSAGKYKVKVLESGDSLHELEYDEEPSFDSIVTDLKAALGS